MSIILQRHVYSFLCTCFSQNIPRMHLLLLLLLDLSICITYVRVIRGNKRSHRSLIFLITSFADFVFSFFLILCFYIRLFFNIIIPFHGIILQSPLPSSCSSNLSLSYRRLHYLIERSSGVHTGRTQVFVQQILRNEYSSRHGIGESNHHRMCRLFLRVTTIQYGRRIAINTITRNPPSCLRRFCSSRG